MQPQHRCHNFFPWPRIRWLESSYNLKIHAQIKRSGKREGGEPRGVLPCLTPIQLPPGWPPPHRAVCMALAALWCVPSKRPCHWHTHNWCVIAEFNPHGATTMDEWPIDKTFPFCHQADGSEIHFLRLQKVLWSWVPVMSSDGHFTVPSSPPPVPHSCCCVFKKALSQCLPGSPNQDTEPAQPMLKRSAEPQSLGQNSKVMCQMPPPPVWRSASHLASFPFLRNRPSCFASNMPATTPFLGLCIAWNHLLQLPNGWPRFVLQGHLAEGGCPWLYCSS
jgi:hypothetical protein